MPKETFIRGSLSASGILEGCEFDAAQVICNLSKPIGPVVRFRVKHSLLRERETKGFAQSRRYGGLPVIVEDLDSIEGKESCVVVNKKVDEGSPQLNHQQIWIAEVPTFKCDNRIRDWKPPDEGTKRAEKLSAD